MHRRHAFAPMLLVLLAASTLALSACDDGSASADPDAVMDGDGTTTTPMASEFEIQSCKESCNQLKFFDCNDSLEHAACFAHCEQASSDAIELFDACVRTDICDPTCGQQIEPPTPVEPTPTDDCTTLCGGFALECPDAGTDASLCSQVCADPDTASLAEYCLSRRAGCTLPEECVDGGSIIIGPPDPADTCKDACQSQAFFGCIQPTDLATCQGLCDSVTPSVRDGFSACAQSDVSCSGCYAQLGGSVSVDVSGCQAACDQLAFFDCIDSGAQASCRNTCASSSDASAVDNFIACTQGLCEDDSCLDVLSPAPTTCPAVPCASGESCVGGECVPDSPDTCPEVPCASGESCVAGECVPDSPQGCPAVPCQGDQICQSGQCVPRPVSCEVTLDASDGCDTDEICGFADDQGNTACFALESCAGGQICDKGPRGAFCNQGELAGKDEVCIPDGCLGDGDCVTGLHCADLQGASFGLCTSGDEFDYCSTTADCDAGLTCNGNFCSSF